MGKDDGWDSDEAGAVVAPKRAPDRPHGMILRDVLRTLERDPRVAWAEQINTGALKVAGGRGGAHRFVRFGFVGCSDILGQLSDGRILAVEVKTRRDTTTSEQGEFLALVAEHHGVSGVVRCIADVSALLDLAYSRTMAQSVSDPVISSVSGSHG